MIEPTDEMIDAFNHADYSGTGSADWENEHVRIGLAAVLAVVERDHVVLCGAPRPVGEDDIGALTCNDVLGHDGEHEYRDGDWMVTWP